MHTNTNTYFSLYRTGKSRKYKKKKVLKKKVKNNKEEYT